MTPIPAPVALDSYFLEARSRLLDVAATLDRIDRGSGSVASDPRIERIKSALSVLTGAGPDRAERIQQIFSLPYEANWPIPQPK